MYDSGSIWNSYNDDDYIDESYEDYTRSNARIVTYWNDLKKHVNIKDPIYKWRCFDNASTIRRFIDDIASCLRTFRYSEVEANFWQAKYREQKCLQSSERIAFACLFLVRCALICRCQKENDWNLEKQSVFFEGIGQDNFNDSDWACCIKTAERELQRSSLLRFEGQFNSQIEANKNAPKYCARVLVESGLPLHVFQGPIEKHEKVVEGLKNIWKLYSSSLNDNAYERTIKRFMATGNFKDPRGQLFWLPGGLAGCRNFFSIGLDLLETIGDGIKNNESIKQVLQENGFIEPSDSVINYIFGIRNNSVQKRAIQIKRILHWEDDDEYTSVYVEFEPESKLYGVEQIELSLKEEPYIWAYAENGVVNGNVCKNRYFKHEFSPAELTIKRRFSHDAETYEVLSEVDFSQPVFFKRLIDRANEYEQIPMSALRETSFPICAIFPNGYIEDKKLNLNNVEFTNLSVENDSISCRVYKFDDVEQFNRSGLSYADTTVVVNPPEKNFTAEYIDLNGKRYRNFKISTEIPRAPLRHINSVLFSRVSEKERWDNKYLGEIYDEGDFVFRYYKLDSALERDLGCAVLTLPRGFSYDFEEDSGSYTGIHFFYKDENGEKRRIQNVVTEIDGKEVSKRDWQDLKYNSIIRCAITNNRNEKIILTIPSPIIGISWFYPTTDSWKSDTIKDEICATNYSKLLKLNCIQNNECRFDIVFKIQLVDNGQVLLDFDDRIGFSREEKTQCTIDLPAYLSKLFSATNSLNATVKISAQAQRNGKIIAQTDCIQINRFNEGHYSGDFFCVGIIHQKVLGPNVMPTEEQKSQELWMKVPAIFTSSDDIKWDQRHRIRLINSGVSDTSDLNDFQKLLTGSDFALAQRKIKNYFNSHCHDLGEDAINQIEKSFDLCVKYDIPICNLWVLQATIQDDRIFVQIPNVLKYKYLLNGDTHLCSFDWRLVRPSSLTYAKNDDVKKMIKKHLNENKGGSEGRRNVNVGKITLNQILTPSFCEIDEELPDSWNDECFKNKLKNDHIEEYVYSNAFGCLLCYITKYVVYGKDNVYAQLLNWAMLCLKYLECIDSKKIAVQVKLIQEKIKKSYKITQHREGYNSIVWKEWNAGEFEDPLANPNLVDQILDEDPYTQGQNDAKSEFLERYWLESLKKMTSCSNSERFYFDLYRCPFPQHINREKMDQHLLEFEQKYKIYKIYYKQGWDKVNDKEPVQYCCYWMFLDQNVDSCDDIPEKATIVGYIVHLWFDKWAKRIDLFSVGDELKENLKKMVPLEFLNLKNESDLSEKIESYVEKFYNLLIEVNIERYANFKNLRLIGKKIEKELPRDAEKIYKMVCDDFGNYRSFYNLYVYYYNQQQKECAEAYRVNAERFLDPLIFAQMAKNKEKEADSIKIKMEGKIEELNSIRSPYSDLETEIEDQRKIDLSADIEQLNECKDAAVEEVVALYEKSASLGRSNALVEMALYYEKEAERKRKKFVDSCAKMKKYSNSIPFDGKVKGAFDSYIKKVKNAIHLCKNASRLGNAEACYKYIKQIEKYREDVPVEFKKVLNFSLTQSDKADVIRNESIFNKWFALKNEWVYLRKSSVKGNLKAKEEWEKAKSRYERIITDPRDGKKYTEVFMAGKWWLAQNLKYKFEGVKTDDYGNCFYSIDQARKATIDGWRLPSKDDFEQLNKWCASHSIRKDPAGVSLKSVRWEPDNTMCEILCGTDDFGFAAMPFGMMTAEFEKVLCEDDAFYWTDSINDNETHCVCLSSSDNEMNMTSMPKDCYLSVRLVRDICP